MLRFKYLIYTILIISSCSSKKDILMIQDSNDSIEFSVDYHQIKIKSDDILKIKVISQSPELSQIFGNQGDMGVAGNIQNYQINGYQVNKDGMINLPILGNIKVEGLSTFQISSLISNLLVNQGYLLKPTVDVRLVNAYFTILGEVNSPGRYNFLKNDMDILQAIGIAGDLTINGKRNNIKVLRNKNGKLKVSKLDITSSDFLVSRNFQVMPNDIIIVEPNNSRIKNAGIIGNAGNLLSVLSFVLSSIILITSN